MSEQREVSMTTYVVQVAVDSEDRDLWQDVATVTAPARTKRRNIIRRALEQADTRPDLGEPWKVRVLDAPSSLATTVAAEQPEPELRIGA